MLVFGVPDLPAPLPLVDLDVDEEDRVHLIQPGAWCREGLGCRRLKGPEQTSLTVKDGVAWITGLQGLFRVSEDGTVALASPTPAVDAAVAPGEVLWLATNAGLVRWASDVTSDPILGASVDEVAVLRTGAVLVRRGARRWVIPPAAALGLAATP
jgi:hypothetical protein